MRHITILPDLLPEGEDDGAWVTIGQKWGMTIQVKLWKKDGMAWGSWEFEEKSKLAEVGKNGEVELLLPGNFSWFSSN